MGIKCLLTLLGAGGKTWKRVPVHRFAVQAQGSVSEGRTQSTIADPKQLIQGCFCDVLLLKNGIRENGRLFAAICPLLSMFLAMECPVAFKSGL
jgi:hypothetical protein